MAVIHSGITDTNIAYAVTLGNLRAFEEGNGAVICRELSDVDLCVNKAVREARKSARNGNVLAQYQLGKPGHPYYVDRRWLARSAKARLPGSSISYGHIITEKSGSNRSGGRAWRLEYTLGLLYYYGVGTPSNKGAGIYWSEKASQKGHKLAQVFLNMSEASR